MSAQYDETFTVDVGMERPLFEQCYADEGFDFTLDEDNEYMDNRTQYVWSGWLSRAFHGNIGSIERNVSVH